ncbi:acetyl-CoA carboxylase biotin carboxyl carrier protein [Vallitalea okinawensis]|uniref:acetyl-CoA carboxylase biotin carboxyl carrier protein n=1 Tax=Vallitalea okinawensis TaxID=2078660 RepID=UPI000CFCDC72|nr:acetyl-CoA carboxylase biotin carboxyl carrier protein [Vallitalea okinawensis]
MDFKDIEKLVKLTDESGLTHLEIKDKDFKITLKKEKEQVSVPYQQPISTTVPVTTQSPSVAQPVETKADEKVKPDNIKVIKAPMVGTFYAASGPDVEPFVKVGDKVKQGDTVCILEAMKLMNDIESEFTGTVVNILVANEDMVEYGQPLMEIEV